jgi:phosphoribosylformylglycinamidine synthase
LSAVGARPLAITNCLNFGNPTKPEIFYQLSEAVRGIGDACNALGTPVTGGNVSLYNENPDGAIWPTPIIGMVGVLEHPAKPVKAGFMASGLHLLLLGPGAKDLGGSEYVRWKTCREHGPCPQCNLQHERALIDLLVEAAASGHLAAAQDCGVGGLFVALAESVLLGNCGAEIDLQHACGLLCELVSETPGRVVVAVDEAKLAAFDALCRKHGVPVHQLGRTTTDPSLVIRGDDETTTLSREQLSAAYYSTDAIFPPGAVAALAH